jgi:hypothetical protein
MVTGKAVALFEEIRRRGGSRQLEAFLYLVEFNHDFPICQRYFEIGARAARVKSCVRCPMDPTSQHA